MLLAKYYNINKLRINNDKNKMIIINKPKWDNIFKNFSFRAGGEVVYVKPKIKVLGIWFQNDLKMDAQVNKLASNLHNRINSITKIKKYTNFKTRLNFLNAYVIGKMNYMLPIYNNVLKYMMHKFHKILMKSARCAIGNYCFRKSTSYILDKCKWMTIEKMITYSSLVFIHNIIKHKIHKGVHNIYRNSRFNRHKANISLTYRPINQKCSRCKYLNVLTEIKEKSNMIFKRELKMWIKNQPVDTYD